MRKKYKIQRIHEDEEKLQLTITSISKFGEGVDLKNDLPL